MVKHIEVLTPPRFIFLELNKKITSVPMINIKLLSPQLRLAQRLEKKVNSQLCSVRKGTKPAYQHFFSSKICMLGSIMFVQDNQIEVRGTNCLRQGCESDY